MRRRALAATCLGALVASPGCSASFDVHQGILGPFRLAAMGVAGGVARAALYSGEGLYHTEAPGLSWSLDGAWIGDGFDVEVPGEGILELVASSPDGTVQRGEIPVVDWSGGALGVERQAVELGDDLSLEARRAVAGEPIDTAAPSGAATRLTIVGLPEGHEVHWMTVEGEGTLLELEADAADAWPELLTLEGDQVVDRQPASDGLSHHLALALDGTGDNNWVWVDAASGDPGPFVRHGGRLLRVDAAPPEGTQWLAATLRFVGGVEGFVLDDTEPLDALDLDQQQVGCGAEHVPFLMSWVAEGRCTVPELDGARVVLEIW